MSKHASPLTDEVVGLLATHGDRSPHGLVGFFTGLFSIPQLIPPSRWMPDLVVFDDRFADRAEAQAFVDAMMAFGDEVGRVVEVDPMNPRLYPRLDDADAVAEWCIGYLWAVCIREEEMDDDDPALPILDLFAVLARLVDAEEALGGDGSVEECLAAHRAALPVYVCSLCVRWLCERMVATASPARARWGSKVGRNDPCPCGRGKKYKKCCLQ